MTTNAHQALLQECRDLFRDHLLEAVAQTFDGMEESLMILAEKATDPKVCNRYLEARVLARQHRELVAEQFSRRLMAEFQERVDRSAKVQQAQSFNLDSLSIIGDDEMNETLSFNGMASRMRWLCEEEMGALDQRAAVLLGLDKIASDDNPFGARVVTDAFKQACQQADCPLDIRLVFLKSFETLAMDGIRLSCREVNDVLVANAILPKIRYGVQKTMEGKAPPPAMARAPEPMPTAQSANAPAAPAPAKNDVFAMLAQMLGAPSGFAGTSGGDSAGVGGSGGGGGYGGGGGSGGGGNGGSGGGMGGSGMVAGLGNPGEIGQAIAGFLSAGSNGGSGGVNGGPALGVGGVRLVEGAQLMGSLTSLQRGDLDFLGDAATELQPILSQAGNLQNVLRQLKGTSVGASMGQVDAMTLEIVSMLFDALFDDAKIPLALKGLIGRLQLPMLKVAIADKELFSSKAHPARQLLDTLGQVGLRLPQDFGAEHQHFARIEGHVQSLVDGFQENMEIFEQVRVHLQALLAEEDTRISREMEASERELEQSETLALSKAEVQGEIRARLQARSTPRAIAEFLVLHWVKYMVTVRAREGREGEGWKAANETTDQLLWSVQPKNTAEDRKKLMAMIPALLKALKAGVTAGGIDEAAESTFFAALMARHREIMRVAAPTTAALVAEAVAAPANDDLDFTAPVVMNNPFGEGRVEVNDDDLDFTQVAGPALEPVEAASPAAAGATLAPVPPRPVRQGEKIRLPLAMKAGAWVSLEDDAGARPARLHYVSPLKSHFLFVDRQGNKVFECSRSMLARRLKLGEVRLLDGEPDASLFDRILDTLFGKMRAAPLAQAA